MPVKTVWQPQGVLSDDAPPWFTLDARNDAASFVWKFADLDILESNGHGWTLVNLQGNHPVGRGFVRLLVDHFGGHRAIDEMLQVVTVGDDSKIIPLTWMDAGGQSSGVAEAGRLLFAVFLDRDFLPTLGQDATTFFLVENAGVAIAEIDISLITADDKFLIIDQFATVLNPGITSLDFELGGELKVIRLPTLPDQKRVSADRFFLGGTAHDLTVFG